MTGIDIRAAVPQDIAAITRIYAEAVRHGTATFELEPPDAVEMARRFAALHAGGFPFLVAETAGAVAGYAYAGEYRSRPAYRWTLEDSIYVATDRQRRGIGRALIERLVREAERRGFRQMIAVIGDSQQHASIALHAAAGFQMVGTHTAVGFKFDRWLDTVLMQRALGAGASGKP
ncbi:MAG TPA: GNAT family N-acetyltransferase [Xanthobacteraceae bacterium]